MTFTFTCLYDIQYTTYLFSETVTLEELHAIVR